MKTLPGLPAKRLARLLAELGYLHRNGRLNLVAAAGDIRRRGSAPFSPHQLKMVLRAPMMDITVGFQIAEALGFDPVELVHDGPPTRTQKPKEPRATRGLIGTLEALDLDLWLQ